MCLKVVSDNCSILIINMLLFVNVIIRVCMLCMAKIVTRECKNLKSAGRRVARSPGSCVFMIMLRLMDNLSPVYQVTGSPGCRVAGLPRRRIAGSQCRSHNVNDVACFDYVMLA